MKNLPLLAILIIIVGSIFISTHSVKQKEEMKISLEDFSTDKKVYHSSEVVSLNAIIHSDSNLENVTVEVNGINGRLNKRSILNLNNGLNEISFTYKLPRCNVCGGIRPGDYDLSCEVTYKSMTIKNFTTIKIQQ